MIASRKEGRKHLCRPLVEEADCIRAQSRSFLNRFFGGSLAPMLANFVEDGKLSRKEIEALKWILETRGR